MRPRWLMMIDWTAVIALATVVAAFAALFTAGVVIWQTRTTVSNQAVLQLLTFWQSEPMYPRIRGGAARDTLLILEKEKRGEDISDVKMAYVDDVLDFFETVSFLTNSRVLGPETTYQIFFDPMAHYWVLHKKYIRTARDRNPVVWKQYSQLMERLFTNEREPTAEEARNFILDELYRCKKEK
jgi:hypothetical protein